MERPQHADGWKSRDPGARDGALRNRLFGPRRTRWLGKGHFYLDSGRLIIYGGTEGKCEAGVAMILDRKRSQVLQGYDVISERILTVRLSARPFNLTLI